MGEGFSSYDRDRLLNEMTQIHFDVLIIGGGITGAGILLDATVRGMKAALIDVQDFSGGTSSRSTKLVHGGLRYLKQLEVGMVAEVGKERAIVYENGPHVTTPEWMMLPCYKGGTFGMFSTSLGLRVYDFLASVRSVERRSMLSVSETLNKEPLLKREGLLGSGYYVEYRTDDARLTIEVLKEAVSRGAIAVNYVGLTDFNYESGKISGGIVQDKVSGVTYEISASKTVNATGPWVDGIRELDQSKHGKMLQLTKGVHLVFDQSRLPLRQAVYFDTPDKRMMFAIPRDGKTYIGTTDTLFKGEIANPRVSEQDRRYIIHAINDIFPQANITERDVESSWAGVRPLIYEEGKSPSEISRKDEIWESKSGLITIAGGKLTGYRKMAEIVVDRVAIRLRKEKGLQFSKCSTKVLPISGGAVGGSAAWTHYVADRIKNGVERGIPKELAEAWSRKYGSNVDRLFNIAEQILVERENPVPEYMDGQYDLGVHSLTLDIEVPLKYAINEEMAVTPVDYFVRRTGALLFDIEKVQQWKDEVLIYMTTILGWTKEQKAQYAIDLETMLSEATSPDTS